VRGENMAEYHYETNTSKQMIKLHGLKKDLLQSFGDFNNKVFADGALPAKTKELIAIAAAHITRCPYCIAGHTKRAKQLGASEEEIAEAIFVAAAMNAGASIAHSSIAMKALEPE
jgi:AhpD family alkylhydroperoxidase